jgi:FkbM family methyltransferase
MGNNDLGLMTRFIDLLKILRPHLICDIGSMDGGHSAFFRNASPASRIIAFEANPYNYMAGVRAGRTAEYRVEWEHLAISDVDDVIAFNVLPHSIDISGDLWKKGGSSILHRKIGDFEEQSVVVPCRCLDSFLLERGLLHTGKALWIDVEGAADLVLKGAEEALKSTLMIHVEVESAELFAGQALDKDIIAHMRSAGFTDIMSGNGGEDTQYDVLLVSDKLLGTFNLEGVLAGNARP